MNQFGSYHLTISVVVKKFKYFDHVVLSNNNKQMYGKKFNGTNVLYGMRRVQSILPEIKRPFVT